jgi:plasmid maintenance system killer protein
MNTKIIVDADNWAGTHPLKLAIYNGIRMIFLEKISGLDVPIQALAAMQNVIAEIDNLVESFEVAETITQFMTYADKSIIFLKKDSRNCLRFALFLREINRYIIFDLNNISKKKEKPTAAGLLSAIEMEKHFHVSEQMVKYEMAPNETLELYFGEHNFPNLTRKLEKARNKNATVEQNKLLDIVFEAVKICESARAAQSLADIASRFVGATINGNEALIPSSLDEKYSVHIIWDKEHKKIANISLDYTEYDRTAVDKKFLSKDFVNKETEELFMTGHCSNHNKIPKEAQARALNKLDLLNGIMCLKSAAERRAIFNKLANLNPVHGNKLEYIAAGASSLGGRYRNYRDFWSIRTSQGSRILFKWDEKNAKIYAVEFAKDYH